MEMIDLQHIRKKISGHRFSSLSDKEGKHACVMVTLVRKEEQLFLLLTKRSDTVEHHKGQISFPGGVVDETDESANYTALRELEEEIGFERAKIEILGRLDDIHIPTGFIVTPVVGYIDCLSDLTPSKDEVAEILLIPLEKFFDPTLQRTETRVLLGKERQIPVYDVWKEPVWGATAHIIQQFVTIISDR